MSAPATRKALFVNREEAELIRDALDYWMVRLSGVKCDSMPHKLAGVYVHRQAKRIVDRVQVLIDELGG